MQTISCYASATVQMLNISLLVIRYKQVKGKKNNIV